MTDDHTLLTEEQLNKAFAKFDAKWNSVELDTVLISNDPETAGKQARALLDMGYRIHDREPDTEALDYVERGVRRSVQEFKDQAHRCPHGYYVGLKGLDQISVHVKPCPNYKDWPEDPIRAKGKPVRCTVCGQMYWAADEQLAKKAEQPHIHDEVALLEDKTAMYGYTPLCRCGAVKLQGVWSEMPRDIEGPPLGGPTSNGD